MLVLDALTYRHTGAQARDYVYSLRCAAGEITGVTGQSGSGKSTLLDLIAGFLPANSGTLTWAGEDMSLLPPEARPVTILFQNNNLFDHLSAAQNIAIGIAPSLRLSTEQAQKVDHALRDVRLEGYGTRQAAKLSGGERQRVALARALVREKPIILLDEPFSALDGETRHAMLELVREIADTHQRCIIMVTHDKRDCAAIADHHFALSSGELQKQHER